MVKTLLDRVHAVKNQTHVVRILQARQVVITKKQGLSKNQQLPVCIADIKNWKHYQRIFARSDTLASIVKKTFFQKLVTVVFIAVMAIATVLQNRMRVNA